MLRNMDEYADPLRDTPVGNLKNTRENVTDEKAKKNKKYVRKFTKYFCVDVMKKDVPFLIR